MFPSQSALRLVGLSAWASITRRQISDLATHDLNCLIVGPPSSGRRFVARLIHARSGRSLQPFIPVRCDVLPDELFCSQFFGVAAGELTTKCKATLGAARAANGGTLFLGNIDHLDPLSQWELLGFMASRKSRAEGSDQAYPCDVRMLASCSPDVYDALSLGQFDVDLHDQFAESVVETVSLADRTADIPALANYFLQQRTISLGLAEKSLEPSALDWLRVQSWLGNIGELRGLMHELAADLSSDSIDHETIRLWIANRSLRPSLPG